MFEFKKSLGQNFLIDSNITRNIVNSANLDKDTLVIEVGPGGGALSKIIALECKNLICYEIDERLKPILSEELKEFTNIELIFKDFLSANIEDTISKYKYDKLFVIANLPYYITTPIITKLILEDINPEKIIVMVQKEVAERLSAHTNTRDYNSLTVFMDYHYEVKKLFNVSKNCFIPKPKVDSSVIQMIKRDNKLSVDNLELFYKIVRDSFQFKRKNIRNNLSNYNLDIITKALNKHGYDLSVRGEALMTEVFVDIANELARE